MFNWKDFEKTKQVISRLGGGSYRDDGGQHHVDIRPTDLLHWMEFLKGDLGYLTLVELAGVDHAKARPFRFEIVYHLLNMGTHQRMNLHLLVNENEIIPSVKKFFSHADWMEREQAEMLNLSFDKKQDSLLLPKGQSIFPLREDSKIVDWPAEESMPLPKLPMNPNKSEAPYPEEKYLWKRYELLSPMTKGAFEWDVCFDPIKVVDSQIKIGYHHQGLELFYEEKDLVQILQLIDKVNLSAGPTYSIAWAKTIEELFRIKLPERAQALRIVLLELARIADHLTTISEICQSIGQDEFRLFLDAREKVYELFEKFSGHRQGLGISKIGGLKDDLPHGWIVEYQTVSDILAKNLRLIHKSLISQRAFRENLEGEPVNAQAVLQWGVSGPVMRAAGLNFDLRKSQPFYFYRDIDFDIPVGIHGSTYDRYLILYEEIYQSLRIVTQVIDNLPLGSVLGEEYNKNYVELLSILNQQERPNSWHYSAVETPNGEGGFLLLLNEALRPKRLKLKTPSFSIAQALQIFMQGLKEEQLSASLASLSLNRFEMDR